MLLMFATSILLPMKAEFVTFIVSQPSYSVGKLGIIRKASRGAFGRSPEPRKAVSSSPSRTNAAQVDIS